MKIKFKKLHPDAIVPKYAHGPEEDAGMDLYAVEDVTLLANEAQVVKTGLSIELPAGHEAQIRSRSGLSLKSGVTVANSPGTVDPGYRGELGVILTWSGRSGTDNTWRKVPMDGSPLPPRAYTVAKGDRIAQLVVAKYEPVEWEECDELLVSNRQDKGFGSTGV